MQHARDGQALQFVLLLYALAPLKSCGCNSSSTRRIASRMTLAAADAADSLTHICGAGLLERLPAEASVASWSVALQLLQDESAEVLLCSATGRDSATCSCGIFAWSSALAACSISSARQKMSLLPISPGLRQLTGRQCTAGARCSCRGCRAGAARCGRSLQQSRPRATLRCGVARQPPAWVCDHSGPPAAACVQVCAALMHTSICVAHHGEAASWRLLGMPAQPLLPCTGNT